LRKALAWLIWMLVGAVIVLGAYEFFVAWRFFTAGF